MALQLPIVVSGINPDGSEFSEATKTINVSTGGAYFGLQQPLLLDHEVVVSITPPPKVAGSLNVRFTARGHVVRCEPEGPDGGYAYFAVQFSEKIHLG